MAKLKKGSWEMMLYYPLGWMMLFGLFAQTFEDWGLRLDMLGMLWMYTGCLLAFYLVDEHNKPPKRVKSDK